MSNLLFVSLVLLAAVVVLAGLRSIHGFAVSMIPVMAFVTLTGTQATLVVKASHPLEPPATPKVGGSLHARVRPPRRRPGRLVTPPQSYA